MEDVKTIDFLVRDSLKNYMNMEDVKMKLSCETRRPSKTESGRCENEAFINCGGCDSGGCESGGGDSGR